MPGSILSRRAATAVRTRWAIRVLSPLHLFYHGAEDEVRLGDHIRVRRWLRSDLLATVKYIPGQSPPDPNILDHQWAYETGDGFVHVMDHEFLAGQSGSVVPKCIEFVCRSNADLLGDQDSRFMFQEYDVVRVVRLAKPDREFEGTETVSRAPQVGDIATIVHSYGPADETAPLAVECVAEDGPTIWLAHFSPDELELESRPG